MSLEVQLVFIYCNEKNAMNSKRRRFAFTIHSLLPAGGRKAQSYCLDPLMDVLRGKLLVHRFHVEESAPISLDSVTKYLSRTLKDTSLYYSVDANF